MQSIINRSCGVITSQISNVYWKIQTAAYGTGFNVKCHTLVTLMNKRGGGLFSNFEKVQTKGVAKIYMCIFITLKCANQMLVVLTSSKRENFALVTILML